MATLAGGETPQKSSYASYRADQGFFLGLALALSLLTLLGFGQLAARGITDPIGAPFRVHAHALLLVGWLALFCTQNWLVYAGNIKLHRMLGWLGVALVAAILLPRWQRKVDLEARTAEIEQAADAARLERLRRLRTALFEAMAHPVNPGINPEVLGRICSGLIYDAELMRDFEINRIVLLSRTSTDRSVGERNEVLQKYADQLTELIGDNPHPADLGG